MPSSFRRAKTKTKRIHRQSPPGAPPGTLAVNPASPRPVVRVIAYGPDAVEEARLDDLAALPGWLQKQPVTWINVDGLGDARTIEELGRIFGIHALALEDVINVHQRSKLEYYDRLAFMVARMAEFRERVTTEQLSLFLGDRFVLTFQEDEGDCLDPVRVRIREGRGLIRTQGADFLAYSLLDSVIDHYFPILEEVGEQLDALDDQILLHAQPATLRRIHDLKRDLAALRRAIWPLRETLALLQREGGKFFKEATLPFLRDAHDHTLQIVELIEADREIISGLVDIYLSGISNRMNEVMKVLTIIATIFIPLSFIAGVYGMNFNTEVSPWNMPEVNWAWGYPFALSLMAGTAAGLLYFFRRKGWLGRIAAAPEEPKS